MSFSIKITPKDRATGRFMSRVHRALIKAINKSKEENKMTQVQIADALGVDKSVVTRILNGEGNLTLKTIGDISWVMGLQPEFSFQPIVGAADLMANHHAIKPSVTVSVPQPRMETTRPVEFLYHSHRAPRPSATVVVINAAIGGPVHVH